MGYRMVFGQGDRRLADTGANGIGPGARGPHRRLYHDLMLLEDAKHRRQRQVGMNRLAVSAGFYNGP